MKIIQIIPTLNTAGAEKFTVDLSNELSIQGADVTLISLRNNDINNPACLLSGLSKNVHYISLGKGAGLSIKVIWRLSKIINNIKPDVINTHTNTFEYAMLNRIFNRKMRFFHTVHTLAEKEVPNRIIKKLRLFFYKMKNHIPISISQETSKSFKEYYGIDKDIIIENGTKPLSKTNNFKEVTESLFDTKRPIVFMNVGRIEPVKNQILFAKAIAKVNLETEYFCKGYIIGAPLNQEIVKELESIENIELLGLKNNVGDYLLNADAFCITSIREGLPMSLLEAMSIGIIPICTKVGGIPNVVEDGNNGLLSETLSVEEYFETMIKFLKMDINQKKAMSDQAFYTFNSKYHIKTCAANYLHAYQNV